MMMRYLLGLALLMSVAAQSAPLANLVLSCPDASAIDQPVDACHGYIYEIPLNELIVVSSSYVWRKAAGLAASDLLQVCTIPVEPGAYSSCRDSAGIRRTAFVPKDNVIGGGRNFVTVSKSGGDYNDPVTAAANAFLGNHWCSEAHPTMPCVIAIGDGIFVLRKTMEVSPGPIVVSGNGKGATMLVAANGVETAVRSLGSTRFSDLTIVNSQPGGARAFGLDTGLGAGGAPRRTELHGVAIHVAGAVESVAIIKRNALEILDSEITAVGPAATGINSPFSTQESANVTLQRSHISAGSWALHEPNPLKHDVTVRLMDSRVSGNIAFFQQDGLLEVLRSQMVGDLSTLNGVSVLITESSIKGNVSVNPDERSAREIRITDTNIEGNLGAGNTLSGSFDELTVHGEFSLHHIEASVSRSYIIKDSPTNNNPALFVQMSKVQIEHSFVEGPRAIEFLNGRSLRVLSSVVAGSASIGAGPEIGSDIGCADTYGADYELLSSSCGTIAP